MIKAGLVSIVGAILLSGIAGRVDAQGTSGPRMDMRKDAIEAPVKRLISSDTESLITPPRPAAKSGDFRNPKVRPGLVNWHADFATACEQSKQSGKPVLLFHMMGNLDDGFC